MNIGAKLMATNPPFWSGVIRAFDPTGRFGRRRGANREEEIQEALARDWEMVFGDMSRAWAVVKPPPESER